MEAMATGYYKPSPELEECNRLIEAYWNTKQYDKCFDGHLALAKQGYPLAECQVGYFYLKGLGVCQDFERAFYWTQRSAQHGDRDAQCNLASFYEDGIGTQRDMQQAKYWYAQAALQNQEIALQKQKELENI